MKRSAALVCVVVLVACPAIIFVIVIVIVGVLVVKELLACDTKHIVVLAAERADRAVAGVGYILVVCVAHAIVAKGVFFSETIVAKLLAFESPVVGGVRLALRRFNIAIRASEKLFASAIGAKHVAVGRGRRRIVRAKLCAAMFASALLVLVRCVECCDGGGRRRFS